MSGVINERVCALKLEAMDRITCGKLKSPEKVWKMQVAEIGHQKAMDQTDLSVINKLIRFWHGFWHCWGGEVLTEVRENFQSGRANHSANKKYS